MHTLQEAIHKLGHQGTYTNNVVNKINAEPFQFNYKK